MKTKKIMFVLVALIGLLALGTLTGKTIGASSFCGNCVCEVGETSGLCPEDCFSLCGDAVCQAGEELTCEMDCTGEEIVPEPEYVSLRDGIADWFR